jgi:hypothetical protein
MNDDFYIGYETPIPRRSRPRVLGAVSLAVILGVVLAVLFVARQQSFAAASFNFGGRDRLSGVVSMDPYPVLTVGAERVRLVGPGKRGAEHLAGALAGAVADLEGALIQRGSMRAFEVATGRVTESSAALFSPPATVRELGEMTLSGEIVDGKCYLGVMNPGEGTVHRDCAVACIRGGLPPLFRVRTDDGRTVLLTLTSRVGGRVNDWAAPLAGRPLSIRGSVRLVHPGGEWQLRADPPMQAGLESRRPGL